MSVSGLTVSEVCSLLWDRMCQVTELMMPPGCRLLEVRAELQAGQGTRGART